MFRSYARNHTQAKIAHSVPVEQIGAAAAFERCRELAERICAEPRIRKPGRLNPRALAGGGEERAGRARCPLDNALLC